jgi:tetratricopeptide (TPR) repeat protein
MAKAKNKKSAARSDSRSSAAPARTAAIPMWRREWFWAAVLFVLIVAVFSPVLWADLLWDDGMFVSQNPVMYSPRGLIDIWTTKVADVCPLTLSLFWFEHPLWGMAPLPYHIVTVLLHGASAIALWRLLKILNVPGAWLGATLWALHPVNAESVAWIAETKNTFSGLFYWLAAIFFVKMLRTEETNPRGATKSYAWSLVFSAAAMAAKSSTIVLPVALGVVAWWQEGRWRWRRLAQLAPMLVFAALAAAASMWTQSLEQSEIINGPWHRSLAERLVTSGYAIWFYLGKLAWPDQLMMIYPRWQIDASDWISWLPLVAAIVLFAVLWVLRARAWAKPWFIAYAYFLIAILPVVGIVDSYFSQFSFVADHFQYLASIGPIALVGAGVARCGDLVSGMRGWPAVISATLVAIFAVACWDRAWAFENSETVWSDTLAKNPDSWVGANNLGNTYAQKGDIAGAVAMYQKALQLHPEYAEAENNLGTIAASRGNEDEAALHYRRALQIKPMYADASYNLATIFLRKHQYDQGLAQLQATLKIDPDFAPAHYDIGNVYQDRNQLPAAIAEYNKALSEQPDLPDARNNLAVALVGAGRIEEAKAQLKEILRTNPKDPHALQNLERIEAAQPPPFGGPPH